MANVTLPTFPALSAGTLFLKGFANNGTLANAQQYVTFGHAFQIGQLPSGGGLEANFGNGAALAQVDVKTKYDDGSAAFTVVTVQVPAVAAGATVWGQFSAAAAPTGAALSLPPVLAGKSLVLALMATSPAGTASLDLAAMLAAAPADLWLSGPLAVQGRAWKVLFQTMRAVVDWTAYADGSICAAVRVTNDVATIVDTNGFASATGGTIAHSFTLTLNGALAYTSPALTQYLYEDVVVRVGAQSALQVITDPADFIAAQAAQSYNLAIGVDPSNLTTAQGFIADTGFGVPLVNPGAAGAQLVYPQMGATGGRPDIGINDAWPAFWFVTQDPTFWAVAEECVKVAAGIPWHYFDAANGCYARVTDWPYLWAGVTGQTAAPQWLSLLQTLTADPNWSLDQAHFPELVYLQYLHTGRRDYLDELNAVFAWLESSNWPAAEERNLGQGLFTQGGQLRQGAWGLRNALYAVYANPDGSADKGYAQAMLANNLAWVHSQLPAWQALQGPTCYGWQPNWSYGVTRANWEENYWTSQITWAAIQGAPGALAIVQWMSNFLIGIWNQPDFPQVDAVAYENVVFATGGSWDGTTKPLQTWAEIEAATQAAGYSNVVSNGPPVVTNFATKGQSQGDYGQLFWISLANLQTLGITGAAAALTALQTLKDSAGNPVPYIDPASWALGPLLQITPRTWNASQVLATAVTPPPPPPPPTLAQLVAQAQADYIAATAAMNDDMAALLTAVTALQSWQGYCSPATQEKNLQSAIANLMAAVTTDQSKITALFATVAADLQAIAAQAG